jgi:hypothetical protein
MKPRTRVSVAAAGIVLVALLAGLGSAALSPSGVNPSAKSPTTVTRDQSAATPAGLTVTDLHDAAQLQVRFNADQGHPRLVLALAPT